MLSSQLVHDVGMAASKAENESTTETKLPISVLKPDPKNPRKMGEGARAGLQVSLETFGALDIVFNDETGELVSGHQRIAALNAAGAVEVVREGDSGYVAHPKTGERFPIRFVRWDATKQRMANLVANNPGLQGEFDERALAQLKSLEDEVGFEDLRLRELLDKMDADVQDDGKKERQQEPIQHGKELADLGPSDAEMEVLRGKKIIVEFSGGKDSTSAALWVKLYLPTAPVELLFGDLGADYVGFALYLQETAKSLGFPLRVLRSDRSVIDEIYEKGEWPHFQAPYCQKLMHDKFNAYLKQQDRDGIVIVRGGRAAERTHGTKAKPSRWLTVASMKGYRYFQPLYYTDKGTSDVIYSSSGISPWSGYVNGLCRTACRICPGQRQKAYAVLRAKYPDVWQELLALEEHCGYGAWQTSLSGWDGRRPSFSAMADKGQRHIEDGTDDDDVARPSDGDDADAGIGEESTGDA